MRLSIGEILKFNFSSLEKMYVTWDKKLIKFLYQFINIIKNKAYKILNMLHFHLLESNKNYV